MRILGPTNFVGLEMDEDPWIGRPFLAVVRVVIDVKNYKLSLAVGDDKIEFDLYKTIKQLFIDKGTHGYTSDNPLKLCLTGQKLVDKESGARRYACPLGKHTYLHLGRARNEELNLD